ncbi:MAG: chromosome segregation protein SMC [Candidatus Aminicenantaceae bacterium]
MIIKRLELQGFKSFLEKTKILFHPGITVIVGPNGTGKSNIVDSILWALGSHRHKSLQGERTEDIIFHGNDKKAPVGLADVVLLLADDEEEMIINHRLFRSGESEYRLNGKVARLKDIQELLWKRSVAEKEYFTIEQGSIDRILTSKPVEKRQYLEEAAGTAYYKEKKRQAQNKLENSEQNLIRLEDIISEVSKAKNSLKRQANAAIKYRKVREKIRGLTFLHYRKKLDQLEKSKAEVTSFHDQSLQREREIISRIKSEEKELASKNRDTWNLEKSIKQGHNNLFTLKSELTRLDSDLEKEEKRIEFFEEKRKKAKINTAEFQEELSFINKELITAETNLSSLKQSYNQNELSLKKAEQEYRSIQEKMATWEKRVESLRNAYVQKLAEHSEIRNEGVKTDKEIEFITYQNKKLRLQNEREKILLEENEKKLDKNKKALSLANKSQEEKKNSLTKLERAKTKINRSIESLQSKISDLKEKKESFNHYLQALKKLREKERTPVISHDIPGAIGCLADLVEADPEFAPLLDIFWKEETRSVLVHAKDLMKNLTGNKIKGNLFLIPSQKKEDSSKGILKHPQVLGLLKSTIKATPKIKKYIPFLEDAVIVKDIKNAIKLWLKFPSLNYITIKGDLLLSSGLMKLGQKEDGIIALTQEIKILEEKIADEDKKLLPLSRRVEGKKKEMLKIENRLQRETQLLLEAEKKVEEIEKKNVIEEIEREKTENSLSLLHRELEILENDRQKAIHKRENFSSKQKKLEEEGERLKKELKTEEKTLAFYQGKNNEGEKHLFELKANLELLQEKIRNTDHQIQTLTQRKKTIKSKIDSLYEDIKISKEEESKSKDNIKNFSEKKRNLQADIKGKGIQTQKDETLLQGLKNKVKEKEIFLQNLREKHEALKEERVKWEVSRAEKDRDLANLEENCWQELKKTLKEVKEGTSLEETKYDTKLEDDLEELNEKLQKFNAVNLMAEEEYQEQKKRYDFLIQQKDDLRLSIDTTQQAIKKIDQESKIQFLTALDEINKNLQEVFSLLFEGGTAELKLTNPENPLESGIEITAQPPGKKLQNMMLLSGGEKALTSLSFLFALFRYKPTPFCILDEVDASLDDVNLARFLELMKKIKKQTQFIIVTHNFKTMEVADYMYGTTMSEPNITSLYSLKMENKES